MVLIESINVVKLRFSQYCWSTELIESTIYGFNLLMNIEASGATTWGASDLGIKFQRSNSCL